MTFCVLRYLIRHADWSGSKPQSSCHHCMDWSKPWWLRQYSFPRKQAHPLLQLDSKHTDGIRALPSHLLPNMRGRVHFGDELRLWLPTIPGQQSVMASTIPQCTWHQYDDHRTELQRFRDVDDIGDILSEWWQHGQLCLRLAESKQSGLEYVGSR